MRRSTNNPAVNPPRPNSTNRASAARPSTNKNAPRPPERANVCRVPTMQPRRTRTGEQRPASEQLCSASARREKMNLARTTAAAPRPNNPDGCTTMRVMRLRQNRPRQAPRPPVHMNQSEPAPAAIVRRMSPNNVRPRRGKALRIRITLLLRGSENPTVAHNMDMPAPQEPNREAPRPPAHANQPRSAREPAAGATRVCAARKRAAKGEREPHGGSEPR